MKDQERANNEVCSVDTEDQLGKVGEGETATIVAVVPSGWMAYDEMEVLTQRLHRRYLVTYTYRNMTHHALAVDDGKQGLARTFARVVRADVERQRYVDSAFPLVLAQLPLTVDL